jgi:isoamylase
MTSPDSKRKPNKKQSPKVPAGGRCSLARSSAAAARRPSSPALPRFAGRRGRVSLGATAYSDGVAFAVRSFTARKIELCLFDSTASTRESERIELRAGEGGYFYAFVPGIAPGQLYGYRAHGPFAPYEGHLFNPLKVLFDPYATEVGRPALAIGQPAPARGKIAPMDGRFSELMLTLDRTELDAGNVRPNLSDSAPSAPLAAVASRSDFDWGNDSRPAIPWKHTIIYETHIISLTKLHPEVPAADRGTLLGLAHPAITRHLKNLGVTTLELQPINLTLDEEHLVRRGLTNYWGYNPIGMFCVDPRICSSSSRLSPIDQLRFAVRALHKAGIEVILDVVLNHSAEGNHNGITACFRGLDNSSYYRLSAADQLYQDDVTGCGNSLQLDNPLMLELALDALRYWAEEAHIDGFRFDLGLSLGRVRGDFTPDAPFFQAINQDPALSELKLIAEPWDLGLGGYQPGAFLHPWREWNGRFRDSARAFWSGGDHVVGAMATALAGSSHTYPEQRGPLAGINFVTCHDGFSLRDLWSYQTKHNEANGEDNRDGSDNNLSSNCGVEGETPDKNINERRLRLSRSCLASLLFSAGVPMLLGGDELRRTQNGNNNAYCQDSAISYYDWTPLFSDGPKNSLCREVPEFINFLSEIVKLRGELRAPTTSRFFTGLSDSDGLCDLSWWKADGQELDPDDWTKPKLHTFAALFNLGKMQTDFVSPDASELIVERDTDFEISLALIVFNASRETARFVLPTLKQLPIGGWIKRLDTFSGAITKGTPLKPSAPIQVREESLQILTANVPSERAKPSANQSRKVAK